MKRCTEKFRCDLCGRYAREGVEETQPLKVTRICTSCLFTGVGLLLRDAQPSKDLPDPSLSAEDIAARLGLLRRDEDPGDATVQDGRGVLSAFELRVLAECSGLAPASPWGAAVGAALEELRRLGHLKGNSVTASGQKLLKGWAADGEASEPGGGS